MTKTQKGKIKKTATEVALAVVLFTTILALGGCISGTAKVDPVPQEMLKTEQAKVKELRSQSIAAQSIVLELKIQNAYLKSISESMAELSKRNEQ